MPTAAPTHPHWCTRAHRRHRMHTGEGGRLETSAGDRVTLSLRQDDRTEGDGEQTVDLTLESAHWPPAGGFGVRTHTFVRMTLTVLEAKQLSALLHLATSDLDQHDHDE